MFAHSIPLSPGDSTLMDGALVIDGSGVNSGSTNHSTGVVSPSEKRTKLYVHFNSVIVQNKY